MHGGGPDVVAGKPLDFVYKEEALNLVEVCGLTWFDLIDFIDIVNILDWMCKLIASYSQH